MAETDPSAQQIIFVFGTSRSGSSALTRVLSLCGAALPLDLLGPGKGNELGHWEPRLAKELNDAILARHDSSWHDPTFRLQAEAFEKREREDIIEQIGYLLQAYPPEPLVVVKEPRIVALADFWLEAVRRAGLTAKFVIPVRHPNEAAASLTQRDEMSPHLANALWLKYNLLAEQKSRGFPRVFVEYGNLLRDWRREVARVADALDIDLSNRDEAGIDAFVDPDHCHQRDSSDPAEPFGDPWIGPVYNALLSATRDAPVDIAAFDRAYDTFTVAERTFRTTSDEFRARFRLPTEAKDVALTVVE